MLVSSWIRSGLINGIPCKQCSMNHHDILIEVAVALPVFKTYTYAISGETTDSVPIGKRVLVSFKNRRVTGYILGQCERTPHCEIKQILDVLDDEPLFPATMVPFYRWIAEYYMHPIGEVIKAALPAGLSKHERSVFLITRSGRLALKGKHGTALERQILNLIGREPKGLNQLSRKLKQTVSIRIIQSMINRRWVERIKTFEPGHTGPRTLKYATLKEPFISQEGLTPKRKQVIQVLSSDKEIPIKKLKETAGVSDSVIKGLADSGHISVYDRIAYRNPFGEPIEPDRPPQLTLDQEKVVSEVMEHLNRGFQTFLLAGVTGSGKTEVYMRLASEVIQRGRSVLVLVPEIALISQMEHRFRARFGERVAILHSQLSKGERYDQWMRILKKNAGIAIGARSAVFAPFSRTGIIIVDEEHDSSYKQEGAFRYNARDLAVVRAKMDRGLSLLGSATPSIESYYNARNRKFIELNLNRRVEERPMPDIEVVDLRNYRDVRGKGRFLTRELHRAMGDVLEKGEQVLLFLNRRGFAGFPVCGSCGETVKCKHCDITLTLHQKLNAYKCHYCGFMRAAAIGCDICGSSSIKNMGIGTEKVESAVSSMFPDANIARMDRDTTGRKGAILRLLKNLRDNQIDILVGTQMVAKGHDFPNITLVGIICADLSLNFPDFRAGERTFQLLAQVAGRAGRGNIPGRVILQTYNPDHFSIQTAREQDFKGFYCREIEYRKALNYPPFSRMIQYRITGSDKIKTRDHAQSLGQHCRDLLARDKKQKMAIEVLGPIEAAIAKIARQYRFQILLKGMNVRQLQLFSRTMMLENPSLFNQRNIGVAVDVDPFFMM